MFVTDPDVLGGTFSGEVDVDFFGGQQPSSGGRTFPLLRMRRARGHGAVGHAQLLFGQESPLVAERSPRSLASVGFPDFAGAGNLWLWIPQARVTIETGYTRAPRAAGRGPRSDRRLGADDVRHAARLRRAHQAAGAAGPAAPRLGPRRRSERDRPRRTPGLAQGTGLARAATRSSSPRPSRWMPHQDRHRRDHRRGVHGPSARRPRRAAGSVRAPARAVCRSAPKAGGDS